MVATFFIVPGLVRELVAVRGQQLTPERKHHRQDVLRAGIGEHRRGVSERRTARAKRFQKLRRIIARVPSGGNFDPLDVGITQAVDGVRLTKRDVGRGQRGVGLTGDEHRGASGGGGDEPMGARAVMQQLRDRGIEFRVGPDRESHGGF